MGPIFAILLTAFLFYGTESRADSHPNTNGPGQAWSSAAKTATATINADAGELAIDNRQKKWILKLPKEILLNGDIFISDDGSLVVWILKRSFFKTEEGENPRGLIFIKNGLIVAEYGWKELMVDPSFAAHSTSHIHWLRNVSVDFAKGSFTLETRSYWVYTFSLSDGKITTKTHNPEFEKAEIIVDGKMTPLTYFQKLRGIKTVPMKISRWIKGDGPTDIEIEWTSMYDAAPDFNRYELKKVDSKYIWVRTFPRD